MKDFKRTLISREADRRLRDAAVTSLPVDIFALAQRLDITVSAAPSDSNGWSGMLLRSGSAFAIAYATNIDNEGFQRFSIAHEVGHYCLPGHTEKVVAIDGEPHFSHADFMSNDDVEREADQFAAGLLMPESLVKRLLEAEPSLAAVEQLSDTCKTSLTAAGRRFAELASQPVAVVMTRNGRVQSCAMSKPFRNLQGLEWLKGGAPIPPGTATDRVHRSRTTRADDTTTFEDWFGGGPDCEVVEEVVSLGSYGRVLTVLSAPGLDDDDYEQAGSDATDEPTFTRSRRR